MFKRLAILAALLSACGTQTSTPPRIVTFDDVFAGYTPIENECDWQKVDISVFNQKDQRVSFRHRYCKSGSKFIKAYNAFERHQSWIMGTVKMPLANESSKNNVKAKMQTVNSPLFYISKLGPDTPQEAMRSIEKNVFGSTDEQCEIEKLNTYLWAFKSDAASSSICNLSSMQYFAIKKGIIIGYPAPGFDNGYIDPASITYTNRG